jgi:hypothetical protein
MIAIAHKILDDLVDPVYTIIKSLLVAGLGLAMWYATFDGMLQLIEANFGSLDFRTKVVIGFTVSLLTFMIILILHEFFKPKPVWLLLLCIAGYIFLSVISVGFGFSFYWKLINSKVEATEGASAAVTELKSALEQGKDKLVEVQHNLQGLAETSKGKASLEITEGGTCDKNKEAKPGPRRDMRRDDAKYFDGAAKKTGRSIRKMTKWIEGLNHDFELIQTGERVANQYVGGVEEEIGGPCHSGRLHV